MNGISATTGKALGDMLHLRQSITDILTTRKGARVMRRDYGSDLPDLIDAPMNRETLLKIFVATADAIQRWETRFQIQRVYASSAAPGSITLDLTGLYVPTGKQEKLMGIKVS
ncbi:GPW/gp25 family protein [Burkholderia alba]|uniref:GPW/gp25 family protein n=1 Tax=Burkholderia alba TaxID=2683677 RepID=UPI002B05F231|nr:GPW/gp25 family protein [Burkholderia alba]